MAEIKEDKDGTPMIIIDEDWEEHVIDISDQIFGTITEWYWDEITGEFIKDKTYPIDSLLDRMKKGYKKGEENEDDKDKKDHT